MNLCNGQVDRKNAAPSASGSAPRGTPTCQVWGAFPPRLPPPRPLPRATAAAPLRSAPLRPFEQRCQKGLWVGSVLVVFFSVAAGFPVYRGIIFIFIFMIYCFWFMVLPEVTNYSSRNKCTRPPTPHMCTLRPGMRRASPRFRTRRARAQSLPSRRIVRSA